MLPPLSTVLASVTGPFHLLSFAALLGTELYQSFVITKVVFRALPRPAFIGLQKQLFPIYFKTQSVLLLLTLVTVPPWGPLSLISNNANLIPLVLASITAALNLFVYGPRARKAMLDRFHFSK